MFINNVPFGDRPPAGSTGELIYDILDRACYPWENFAVGRWECGGWVIKFYTIQYNTKFHVSVVLTDELINHMEGGLLVDSLVRSVHDLRMYITKHELENKYKRAVNVL